jgi:hypothetical protein
LLGLLSNHANRGDMFLRFVGLHYLISKKTELLYSKLWTGYKTGCVRKTDRSKKLRKLYWLWRVLSSGIQRRVVRWKSTDVPEEHVASIFGVEEWTKQETTTKAGGQQSLLCSILPKRRLTFNGLYGVISQKIELFITTAVRIPHMLHIACNYLFTVRVLNWGKL